ncbi:MAG TPA: hypothetical protein VIL13_14010 [Longimicrobiales bacterium]
MRGGVVWWGGAALVALLAACDSPTVPGRAEAYEFALETTPPVVYRWPTGKTIRVLVEGGSDAARAELLRAAFEEGAAGWEEAVLYGEFRLAAVARAEEADVILAWSDAPLPVEVWGCPPAGGRAVTTFCLTEDGTGFEPFPLKSAPAGGEGRVRMLVTVSADEAGNAERVRRLVAHELGHVLGIGRHSPDPEDLMSGGLPVTAKPTDRDRGTVQILYHTRPDVVP